MSNQKDDFATTLAKSYLKGYFGTYAFFGIVVGIIVVGTIVSAIAERATFQGFIKYALFVSPVVLLLLLFSKRLNRIQRICLFVAMLALSSALPQLLRLVA